MSETKKAAFGPPFLLSNLDLGSVICALGDRGIENLAQILSAVFKCIMLAMWIGRRSAHQVHIWFSAEVEQGCQSSLKATEAHVEVELRNEMASGKLAAIDLEVCYIPIVMGVDFVDLYPARSSYSKTDNRVYHSPHLNCDLFRRGTREERERAYLNGLLLAKPWLEKAGLTDAQLDEFEVKVKRLFVENLL